MIVLGANSLVELSDKIANNCLSSRLAYSFPFVLSVFLSVFNIMWKIFTLVSVTAGTNMIAPKEAVGILPEYYFINNEIGLVIAKWKFWVFFNYILIWSIIKKGDTGLLSSNINSVKQWESVQCLRTLLLPFASYDKMYMLALHFLAI